MAKKISFLVPAHNEEKVIANALDALAELRSYYPNIEVLVGLDGCTDNTEKIVKKYKFAKSVIFKGRNGKHIVIRKLESLANGEIIAIHDADWIFNCSKSSINSLLSCFDDPKVGGIGDYYSTTYTPERVRKINDTLYVGDAWSTLFLTEYKIRKYCRKVNGKLFVDNYSGFLFFVNFYRKGIIPAQKTLCDDGERMILLIKKDYKVRVLPAEELPNYKVSWKKIGWRDYIRQRVRGFLAQRQVRHDFGGFRVGFFNFYLGLLVYFIKNLHRPKRIRAYAGIFLWWFFAFIAFIIAAFRKAPTTKEGWKMRYGRQ